MTKSSPLAINNRWFHWLEILLGSCGLTILFLYQVLGNLSTKLPSREDGILIAYLINWTGQSLRTGQNLYQVPFFYPFHSTLAYSDPFLSTGLLNVPLSFVTHNLVLMSNVHLVLGTVACLISMYLLVQWVTQSKLAAWLSAIVFTFSYLHFQYIVHLHTYLVAGLPLMVWCWLRWLDKPRWYWLMGMIISFLYQTLNAPMTGFFAVFILVPFLLERSVRHKLWQQRRLVAGVAVVVLGVCIAFYLPYFQVSREFHYTRTIRDAAHFANSLDSLVTPELLICYCVLGWFWSTTASTDSHTRLSLRVVVSWIVIGGVLMLGPALKLHAQTFKILNVPIPLPYAVFYYVIPGFQAFRTSSRWIIVFDFGLSILLGLAMVHSRLPQWTKVATLLGLTSVLWCTQIPGLKLYEIPLQPPAIYSLIQQQSQTTLAEFPVFLWRMMPYTYHENDRLLYQPLHQKWLYNGASGFTPPVRETDWNWLWQHFPEADTIDYLHNQGVQLLSVDFSIYQQMYDAHYSYIDHPAPNPQDLKEKLNHSPLLHQVGCTNEACIYTIQSDEAP